MISPELAKFSVMCVALVIMNICVFMVFRLAFKNIDIADVLREKDVDKTKPPADPDPNSPADNTSYSRVTGFISSIVMTCFLWGISNYLVYAAFFQVEDIAKLMASVPSYFIAGSSLFSPYAVNKITSIFKS